MPRTTQLRDLSATAHGEHKYFQCPFCDYKNRSDRMPAHYKASHTAEEVNKDDTFCEITAHAGGKVLFREQHGKSVEGVCFDCHAHITNKKQTSTEVFMEHVCKERKEPSQRKPASKAVVAEIVKAAVSKENSNFLSRLMRSPKLAFIFRDVEEDAPDADYEDAIKQVLLANVEVEKVLSEHVSLIRFQCAEIEIGKERHAEDFQTIEALKTQNRHISNELELAIKSKQEYKRRLEEQDAVVRSAAYWEAKYNWCRGEGADPDEPISAQ